MKKFIFILLTTLTVIGFTENVNAQHCTGGPSSTYDSNVQQVDITGEAATAISHAGCSGGAGGGEEGG